MIISSPCATVRVTPPLTFPQDQVYTIGDGALSITFEPYTPDNPHCTLSYVCNPPIPSAVVTLSTLTNTFIVQTNDFNEAGLTYSITVDVYAEPFFNTGESFSFDVMLVRHCSSANVQVYNTVFGLATPPI